MKSYLLQSLGLLLATLFFAALGLVAIAQEPIKASSYHPDPCSLRVVECFGEPSLGTIPEIITEAAKGSTIPASKLIALAMCESTLNPDAIGGELGSFRGLYQWNKRSNPEITDQIAFDPWESTKATIAALERGEAWRWPNCI